MADAPSIIDANASHIKLSSELLQNLKHLREHTKDKTLEDIIEKFKSIQSKFLDFSSSLIDRDEEGLAEHELKAANELRECFVGFLEEHVKGFLEKYGEKDGGKKVKEEFVRGMGEVEGRIVGLLKGFKGFE